MSYNPQPLEVTVSAEIASAPPVGINQIKFAANPFDDQQELRWALCQYYEELRVSFSMVKHDDVPDCPALVEAIEALFHKPEQWSHAYEIEQYMTTLYNEQMLDEQLERRLLDLQLHASDERYLAFKKRKATTRELAAKRELLRDITIHVQRYYRTRDAKRTLCGLARLRTLTIFMGALVAFGALLAVSHSEWWLSYAVYDPTTRALLIGVCAGYLGASFSVLLRAKKWSNSLSLDGLVEHSKFRYIILRSATGVGAALILYFLVQSGLLAGKMFPELPISDAATAGSFDLLAHYGNISKMVVWGVIAGFSETLVPNLLQRTESRA